MPNTYQEKLGQVVGNGWEIAYTNEAEQLGAYLSKIVGEFEYTIESHSFGRWLVAKYNATTKGLIGIKTPFTVLQVAKNFANDLIEQDA